MYVFKLKISVERLMKDRIEGGGGRNVTFRGEGCYEGYDFATGRETRFQRGACTHAGGKVHTHE